MNFSDIDLDLNLPPERLNVILKERILNVWRNLKGKHFAAIMIEKYLKCNSFFYSPN
jgi:hypothetical protein